MTLINQLLLFFSYVKIRGRKIVSSKIKILKSENVVNLLFCSILFIKSIPTQLRISSGFKNRIPNIFPSHLLISEVLSLHSLFNTTAQIFRQHDCATGNLHSTISVSP